MTGQVEVRDQRFTRIVDVDAELETIASGFRTRENYKGGDAWGGNHCYFAVILLLIIRIEKEEKYLWIVVLNAIHS